MSEVMPKRYVKVFMKIHKALNRKDSWAIIAYLLESGHLITVKELSRVFKTDAKDIMRVLGPLEECHLFASTMKGKTKYYGLSVFGIEYLEGVYEAVFFI